MNNHCQEDVNKQSRISNPITIFMCGDVMTGRGIDQVLHHPSDPIIYEEIQSAKEYVELAEEANGPIPKPVDSTYIWGEALAELARVAPDLRIINMETSITKSDDYWTGKAVQYRMNPENIQCIKAAEIDCSSLANNHVLDWGYSGLEETLETLKEAGIKSAGAGRNLEEAENPAVMSIEGKGRVIVFSFGSVTSGIPASWAASEKRPGINLLKDFSDNTVRHIEEKVRDMKQLRDIAVASIHWGGNWGFEIPPAQVEFAHKLIDHAHIDIIHGHSSHHVKGIEIYKAKPIIYGCGDFITDYEGISGYEDFRDDLGLMYLVSMNPSSGKLVSFRMIPTQIKNFRVNRATNADALWLRNTMNREGEKFDNRVEMREDNTLVLKWD